jgi:hypothetical protein
MMKKSLVWLLCIALLSFPIGAAAKMGSGKVVAKSNDIDIAMFGSLKMFPFFVENADFNDDDTEFDRLLDESGWFENHSVRSEIRVGWTAKAENWDFLVILESDFNMNKANTDRGADGTNPSDSGMTGEDFGVEKLNFGYNFGQFRVDTGWNTKFLDLKTGGILYGDDHPYIAFSGKINDSMGWEFIYLMIQDEIENNNGIFDGDSSDWRAYTFRFNIDLNDFTLAPIYAYSDNEDHDAQTHYLGFEGYGKFGAFIPRFEFIYATGDIDNGSSDVDISAFGAYASLEMEVSKKFKPYVGGYFMTGDEDGSDEDVDAFNGITNISRYTPTFGMENAMIYRYIPAIGSHLYSNDFATLGTSAGYGGIGNSAKADSPGMIMLGMGAKGAMGAWGYQAQVMYFLFEEEGALEKTKGSNIDNEVGTEVDLRVTYAFNEHFSLGNVISVFIPGDAVEDLRGDGYDDTAFLNTVEMTWKF